ncbi:MAG TPA: flippase-like domain-containing protein [Candidatus Bathyarchaeota archaeon]|nr:flippase-like domain-containing protein [Candidatus Bathyarchaeota archaeon]
MNKRFLLSTVVSIIVLILIFLNFLNFERFLEAFLAVNFYLFLASDIPYLIQAILMGYRLNWAMHKSGIKTKWIDGFLAHLFGMLGSDFSIGRTGYLLSSLPFKSKFATNIGVISALVAVDMIAKATFSIVSAVFFIYFFRLEIDTFLFLFAILIILGGVGFLVFIGSSRSVKFLSKVPLIERVVLPYYRDFRDSLREIRRKSLFIFVFPILGWILRGVEWNILGYAVGIDFPFIVWLMLHPLLSLVRLIPITVTGLGIFEFTFIMLFPDIDAAKQVTFGILDMVNNSFIDVIGLLSLRGLKK